MGTGLLIGGEALIILTLIAALIVGQPAGIADERAQASAQATTLSVLRATVTAMPTPIPVKAICYRPTYPFC